jgi:GTP-binding nuclear protein Ran
MTSIQGIYNILLLGNGGVGKTTFIKSLLGYDFQPRYNPTLGADKHSIIFETNKGKYLINFIDSSGQEMYTVGVAIANVTHKMNIDLTVIMYSVNSRISHKNAITIWKDIASDFGAPVKMLATMADIQDKVVLSLDSSITCRRDSESSKLFVLSLLHNLTGDKTLVLYD